MQMLRWLCLLTLSLPLLFWVGHVITRDGPSPAARRKGLRGYTRIRPGGMDQVSGSKRQGGVYTNGFYKTLGELE